MGSSGTNAPDNNKQQINFYGMLITHQGQKDTIDHILIEGKHNDIIMYDAPVKHAKAKLNSATKQTEIKLDTNPVTDFSKVKIDLSTIGKLRVPNPNISWVYQKEKKHQRLEFLLVQVTAKDAIEPKSYLLEHKTHVSCNSIDQSGSQKKEIPLSAIDTLEIEGYSFAISTDKSIKKETQATCPTTQTETETTTEVFIQ